MTSTGGSRRTGGERPCAAMRPMIGMAALDRLPAAEAAALRAHLDGCRACTAELRGLSSTARLLYGADPERLDEPSPAPPIGLADSVLAQVGAARRTARRRTITIATGAALGLAASVAAALLVFSSVHDPAGRRPDVAYSAGPTQATAELTDHSWGTGLRLTVSGLGDGERYLAWLERADGTRVPAGSFTAQGTRQVTVDLSAAMRADGAVALGLSTAPGGPPVLYAPVRRG
ncbi:zf-HC2 domain-containing protein [Yinghuangia seranimata]|uniref:zf-HC2 domain-containing protein n=1 Tax=Yinghuangia seranimata TaxID=408067 RepID=UPI00248B8FA3|nr:zf-HC2 domain-containing protein [Yinghuangia seranimata]MDI2128241.1 zf-HC2 domain-containing protein [Yinghuangia seranimata]